MWASGDFGVIATLIQPVAEQLADSADLVAGSRVLDVAGGTGNAAIAAARCGCDVTCTDYVPALLERGRERAQAERLDIEFAVADAEALPYADGSYDAVLSVFGAMFAPDQPQAAAELVRVCRPGGLIAPRELDAGGLPRRLVPHQRRARPAARRRRVAAALGHRGGHRRAARRRRRLDPHAPAHVHVALPRRRRVRRPSCATGTARR